MKYTLKNKMMDIVLTLVTGVITFWVLVHISSSYIPEISAYWKPAAMVVTIFGLKEVIEILREKDISLEA
ncbi:hypothetical protein [Tepidibacter thalassicus]|uniref:Uncharacterized protein n=1 Tax=Tepidibacter thalassicus DSM 15285 TaxID=1123350 RepID=A0A1M5QHP0_9FIRM|nr:hypothetical protein [Tepidibacter thalassicus]SHH13381.1 hypothetical protein SAMN02744040_00945 [Tepidibacter thalassicus DSM 15285]